MSLDRFNLCSIKQREEWAIQQIIDVNFPAFEMEERMA